MTFNCDICGMPIIDNDNGHWITGCKHYPLEYLNNPDNEMDCTTFGPMVLEIKIEDE